MGEHLLKERHPISLDANKGEEVLPGTVPRWSEYWWGKHVQGSLVTSVAMTTIRMASLDMTKDQLV